jgi:hypothetical protein
MQEPGTIKPQNPMLIATIIWGALIMSAGFYMFVGTLLAEELKPVDTTIINAIGGFGVLMLVASVIVRQVLANPQRLMASGKSSLEIIESAFPLPIVQLIITWAMAESAALFGLILTIMSGDTRYVFALGGAAILTLVLVHRPSAWRIEDLH